ncbi:MAG: M15 family metallopeptidase [Helicobacteraceae bacterium]|nr:M15 family metallopeptidase [Helicobacteraceae bacterium]
MRRRDFLALTLGTLGAVGCAAIRESSVKTRSGSLAKAQYPLPPARSIEPPAQNPAAISDEEQARLNALEEEEIANNILEDGIGAQGATPKDHLTITQNVGALKPIVAEGKEFELLKATFDRLNAVQKHIGFGNFNVISFDAMISVAKASKPVGAFTEDELEYLEKLFFRDAKEYGFFGSKVTDKLTESIAQKEIFKVPRTGHYLYQGQAAKVYESVKKDIGDTIVMTSGVRGVPKQFHLFLAKTLECKGDYSEASHSLAPAGYSYHGIGDFDVGKVGYGEKNFTQEFAKTKEYEKLMQLGYIAIRYPRGNPYGVYFEPWHVEVV